MVCVKTVLTVKYSRFFVSLPADFSNAICNVGKQRELRGDSWVATRGGQSDVPPDPDADGDAKQGVTPVNQEHQHHLDQELSTKNTSNYLYL